jgi:subtilisin family serine protease
MKRRLLLLAFLFLLFTQQAKADYQVIVRADSGLQAIQPVCALLLCRVIQGLDGALGQVFLISVPAGTNPTTFLQILQIQVGISDAELDIEIKLTQPLINNLSVPELSDSRPLDYFGATVWNGYANQPASQVIGLPTARSTFNLLGAGTVGVIDTGIDPNHPAFRGVVVAGYDFTRNTSGVPSEASDLTQSVSPLVEGEPAARVNDSTAAVLDQDSAVVVSHYSAFGHGTMVSGVIHLVAPRALIMPLKAFRADGTGALSDVIRAVYYGTREGAKVLNMSFSIPGNSKELKRALDFAAARGVISVASAGNDGLPILVYPAAFDNVMGIASTNYWDQRSSFSNYGTPLVWVAAPGEAIVSPYPFATYAASWGTSFSAPFVSGVASLLLSVQPDCNRSEAAAAISKARTLGPDLGYGRLDVYQAIEAFIRSR